MAEKNNTKKTPFELEQAEVAKKILEYKLGIEATIVSMIYKNPDLIHDCDLTGKSFHNNCWRVYFEIAKGVLIDEGKNTLSDIDVGLYLEKHSKLSKEYDECGGYDTVKNASSYVDEKSFDGYLRDFKKWNAIAKMVKMGFPVKDKLSSFADKSAEQIYQDYEGYLNHIFANVDNETKSYNALEGLHELVKDMNEGDNIGLPITAELLNNEIGGLKKGNIYSLTAPSGAGKSTILINYILPKILENNEKCVMLINEEDIKKVRKELLLYCCTNVLKKPIQKITLRDGGFDEETLKTLHEAADWLEKQDKNHNITVIPLEHYTTDIAIKLIKKYKNLHKVDYFILDTFKESSDSQEEGYREMLKSSVKLYDLIKPANLNVCLVMSMQTSKSSLRTRHLTNMDIGQSKSVVDVFSVSILCRKAEPTEYRDEKHELKCFRVEKDEVTQKENKVQFFLEKGKYYLLFFLAKNRFGNTDNYAIVSEVNLSTNEFKDIGYVIVPEDW